jgi:hypothetical protein
MKELIKKENPSAKLNEWDGDMEFSSFYKKKREVKEE